MSQPNGEFIVGEVSKNWEKDSLTPGTTLSERFEMMIRMNTDRGYVLHSWKMTSVFTENHLVETIVAVFRRKDESCDQRASG